MDGLVAGISALQWIIIAWIICHYFKAAHTYLTDKMYSGNGADDIEIDDEDE